MKNNIPSTLLRHFAAVAAAVALLAAGCGPQADDAAQKGAPSIDGSALLLRAEPEGALDVIQVRESAADGDQVVVVGRIGGSAHPWVDGRAAFSIVDRSLKACSDVEGDNCPQPWDYCCETDKLPGATALIQIVDEAGNLIESGAKELLNLKELQTVVVSGQAQRDEAGNLTVLARSVFVRS